MTRETALATYGRTVTVDQLVMIAAEGDDFTLAGVVGGWRRQFGELVNGQLCVVQNEAQHLICDINNVALDALLRLPPAWCVLPQGVTVLINDYDGRSVRAQLPAVKQGQHTSVTTLPGKRAITSPLYWEYGGVPIMDDAVPIGHPDMYVERPGLFEHGGETYMARPSMSHFRRLFAERMTWGDDGEIAWEYDKGVIWKLVEAERMPKERAVELGRDYGKCIICRHPIWIDKSTERIIGPVCHEKFWGKDWEKAWA